MTKILLVEDDKSLREIYGVRLLAEGYDIVSADNGEEALAVAIKERPQLIITDVMMPKISGFDMLDILRSTTETRDIKVIMMTALGSEENRERSERLGADRYLVKSQVGIEDVVRAVHDLLGDQAPTPVVPAAASVPGATPGASLPPAAPLPTLPSAPAAAPAPTVGRGLVSAPAVAAPGLPANQAMPAPATPVDPLSPDPTAADSPSRRARVIQPINDPTKSVDLQALVDKELAKEGSEPPATTDEAREVVAGQLDDFANQPAPAPAVADDTAATDTIAISTDGTLNDTTSDSAPTPVPAAATAPTVPPTLPPVAPAATPPATVTPSVTPSPVPTPPVATPTPVTPSAPPAPSSSTPPPATPTPPAA